MTVDAILAEKTETKFFKKEIRKNLIIVDETLGNAIDLSTVKHPGYMQAPYDKGDLAERYRALKWEILSFQRHGKSLLITSAMEGEGKSAASFNLALSISLERDWQSVFIDTSGGPNSLTSRLGLNQCKGLTDYLNEDASLEQILYRTSKSKCLFVPVGTMTEERSELIASHKMEAFKSEVLARINGAFIVFDSREVKNFADCRILSKVSDKILMIVRSCHTPRVEVHNALYYLPKEKMVGVLVTQHPWA